MSELSWIKEGKKHDGLREIKGYRHNSTILRWLRELRAWWANDETPWCGTFVAHCLKANNRYVPRHWYRAKAYADSSIMTKLSKPAYGCIVVFERRGGGHVGFVVGKTSEGRLMVFGGNQGDQVNVRAFDKSRVLGYYWPSRNVRGAAFKSRPYSRRYNLPVINKSNTQGFRYIGGLSTRES